MLRCVQFWMSFETLYSLIDYRKFGYIFYKIRDLYALDNLTVINNIKP